MKFFALLCAFLFVLNAGAVEKVSTNIPQTDSPFTMEPSFTFSSINSGSRFLSVALTSRLTSWLRIGVEGEVPADFEDKAQIFSGRFLARVPLIDREDKLFLQGSFSFSYFDGTPIVSDPNYVPEYGAATFVNGEVLIGYTRKISPSWSLGGMLGGQYSTMNQYVFNSSTNSVYNRASFIGSYIF